MSTVSSKKLKLISASTNRGDEREFAEDELLGRREKGCNFDRSSVTLRIDYLENKAHFSSAERRRRRRRRRPGKRNAWNFNLEIPVDE